MLKYKNDLLRVQQWWFKNRVRYNYGLLKSGTAAFPIYLVGGALLISSGTKYNEIIFGCLLFGGIFIIYMLIANLLYTLGSIADLVLNINDSLKFREVLFSCGYWISIIPPPLSLTCAVIGIYYDNSHLPL
jgi:hypothetical protein